MKCCANIAATTRALGVAREAQVQIEELLEHYLEEVPLPASVRVAVRTAWPKFLKFCQQHDLVQVSEVERHHVEDFHKDLLWRTHEQGQLYKANSVDQFVRRARQVLRWAFDQGWVTPDPTYGLLLPRPVQPQVRLLSWEQLQAVLAFPDGSTAIGLRDGLVFQLLAQTSLGPAQVLTLTLDSVRELELETATVALLEQYIKEARPALGGQGDRLFFSRDGGGLNSTVVRLRLKQAARHLGLENIPMRVLRKSYLATLEEAHRRLSFPP
jgi:site-specific recombinase XerD